MQAFFFRINILIWERESEQKILNKKKRCIPKFIWLFGFLLFPRYFTRKLFEQTLCCSWNKNEQKKFILGFVKFIQLVFFGENIQPEHSSLSFFCLNYMVMFIGSTKKISRLKIAIPIRNGKRSIVDID